MSNKGLVLTGTRPPSIADFRPRTAPGKRGHYGYHTIAIKSNIDETLFKSHNPSAMSEEVNFRPPWTYKKKTPEEQMIKPKGRPLLWSPQPAVSLDGDVVSNFSSIKQKPHSNSAQTKYRLLNKHQPTFVDESLFGERLQEPSFEAPWGDKKKKTRPYVWVPDTMNYDNTEMAKKTRYRIGRRPNTAMGIRGETGSSNPRPVWKP